MRHTPGTSLPSKKASPPLPSTESSKKVVPSSLEAIFKKMEEDKQRKLSPEVQRQPGALSRPPISSKDPTSSIPSLRHPSPLKENPTPQKEQTVAVDRPMRIPSQQPKSLIDQLGKVPALLVPPLLNQTGNVARAEQPPGSAQPRRIRSQQSGSLKDSPVKPAFPSLPNVFSASLADEPLSQVLSPQSDTSLTSQPVKYSPFSLPSRLTGPATTVSSPSPGQSRNQIDSESTRDEYSSPLSSLIRSIQERHAELKAKETTAGETRKPGMQGLPKWRLDYLQRKQEIIEGMRETSVEETDEENEEEGEDEEEAYNEIRHKFDDEPYKPRKKRKPKKRVVMLPGHAISLVQASQLFRRKSLDLRDMLQEMGSLDESVAGMQPRDIQVDPEALELIALELGVEYSKVEKSNLRNDVLLQRRSSAEVEKQRYETLPPRPPVVTVMGHVDHGKTTLMDTLRKRARSDQRTDKKSDSGGVPIPKTKIANVAGTEAGGITQKITAFQVPLLQESARAVTFLDTPGHAAFRAMRQSGSHAADIIVLVVAADDGVSKQTIEIIEFYKSIRQESGSGISMVVAMNKIDKHGVNVEESRRRIENQLLEHGILVEGMLYANYDGSYGTPVQLFPISALTSEGVDELIEGLGLQSEVMDLRADDQACAEGVVMDSGLVKGLGVVADCIIRWGSVKEGDVVVSGTCKGKVRVLRDVNNNQIDIAGPSMPVRIVGFESCPPAGQSILGVESDEIADEIIAARKFELNDANSSRATDSITDLDLQSHGVRVMRQGWKSELAEQFHVNLKKEDAPVYIPVIIKADADGTLEALRNCVVQVAEDSKHNVVIDPVKSAVGPVLKTEIVLAKEIGAPIICFNIKNENILESLAESEGVPLLSSDVIYSLLDDAKVLFSKMIPKQTVETVHGKASVQAVFNIGKVEYPVAGLAVIDGTLHKASLPIVNKNEITPCFFRVLRDGVVISPTNLQAGSLKHYKEEVESIGRGKECGLLLTGHADYQVGDIIECFSIEEVEQTI